MAFDELAGKKADEFEAEGYSGEPIPAGTHPMRILALEDRENNAGTGNYVALTLAVVDNAPHAGRQAWDNITYKHSTSEKAVEIGMAKIAELTKACGFDTIQKLPEYVGKVVNAKLGIQGARHVGDRVFDARNTVKGFQPYTGSAPPLVLTGADEDVPF